MNIKKPLKNILRPIYRHYLSFSHRGDKLTCNICGKKFKDLRPINSIHADGKIFQPENRVGSCWFCNSYPRMREVWYWLEHEYKIKEKKSLKILHVAPEIPISQKLRKLKGIDYICVDKHCEGYEYPKYVADGDVTKLNFKNEEFDLVICNHVLEHVKEDNKAIKELYRVCKPGGFSILLVPIDLSLKNTKEEPDGVILSPEEREKRFGQYDHVRLYGLDYFDRLEKEGYAIERKIYESNIITKFGLEPEEELVVCRKI